MVIFLSTAVAFVVNCRETEAYETAQSQEVSEIPKKDWYYSVDLGDHAVVYWNATSWEASLH